MISQSKARGEGPKRERCVRRGDGGGPRIGSPIEKKLRPGAGKRDVDAAVKEIGRAHV